MNSLRGSVHPLNDSELFAAKNLAHAGDGDRPKPPVREIPDQFDRLRCRLGFLEEISMSLSGRLSPVLSPASPEPKTAPGPVSVGPRTEVGQEIAKVLARIEELIALTCQIHDTLQI